MPDNRLPGISSDMKSSIPTLRWIFLGAFVLASAGIWGYEWYFVRPGRLCEQAHRWWDAKLHRCLQPIWIPDLTHRPAPSNVAKPWTVPGREVH